MKGIALALCTLASIGMVVGCTAPAQVEAGPISSPRFEVGRQREEYLDIIAIKDTQTKKEWLVFYVYRPSMSTVINVVEVTDVLP